MFPRMVAPGETEETEQLVVVREETLTGTEKEIVCLTT